MTGRREGRPGERRPDTWPGWDEAALVAGLRAGDEAAFAVLVESLHGRLLALARSFCSRPELAEEAVQETWLAVIKGVEGFEGRAPLRSWIFSILVRRARTLAVREKRHGVIAPPDEPPAGDAEGADREPGMGASGRWETPPTPWGFEDPEAAMLGREALAVVEAALERLPEAQRSAVWLRDVEGVGTEDACNILGVSETHFRVLVHRGRSSIRRALDAYVQERRPGPARAGRPRGAGE